MISLRLSAERHHDRRLRREVWRTFAPVDRVDRLAARFRTLEAFDESRLPPRADVPRRIGGEGEIVTYVREGTVAYEDSMGHAGMIHAGEFQRMIATHGGRYSESNASRVDWAHVFQIRLRRARPELEPGREQRRFSVAERRGGLCVVASPDARAGSLRLAQETSIYSALLEPGQHIVHELAPAHDAWLHVVTGEVALDDFVLATGDGAGVVGERAVSLTARAGTEILLFDLAEPPGAARDLLGRRS
jgi:redox-sensitive bicupin YhaK (pirin superfamily)